METKQKNSTRLLISWLLSYLKNYKRLAVSIVLLYLAVLAFELALPRILGIIIDKIQSSTTNIDRYVLTGSIIYFGLTILKSISEFGRGILNTKLNQLIIANLRVDLFKKVAYMPFSFHDKTSSGELITRGCRDVEKIAAFYSQVMLVGGEAVLLLLGTAVMLVYLQPLLSIAALLSICPSIVAIVIFTGKLRPLWRKVDDTYDSVTNVVQENVSGVRVVKAFNAQNREEVKFEFRINNFVNELIKAVDYWTKFIMLPGTLFNVSIPVVFLAGCYLNSKGYLTVGSITTAILYLTNISRRMRIIEHLIDVFQTSVASADRIYEILTREVDIKNSEKAGSFPSKPEICIKDLTFGYEKEKPVLKNLNISIPYGNNIALFGKTGVGKSTLIKLLSRFYAPDSGSIKVNGIDLENIDLHELRRKINIVFQEAFLFNSTISENISFGLPDASCETIKEAADAASAHDFIEELKDKYDTIIGERGISLSGGQKQRISLARAFIMKPPVLVLDDTTSAVDSITEKEIRDAINRISRGRTTIIISQRITSVQNCDMIYVLDKQNGHAAGIVQMGKHEDLISIPGVYQEVYFDQILDAADKKEA
ncbi:MAG: ABC transporter ATP-binding protein [Candidatus Coatesbacteria bacterium]|nr:ABC transporter ATP-binding protein [Candidatus Coatesbacteria bacterium]